jgi:alpha/beta superfamily hydrolase
MEERISFFSGSLRLEGLWRPGADRAVVVTHPHPLYGGDMHNPVVATIANSFARKGYAILRFNFRGTGASEGDFDDGPGERQDLAAALDWVAERTALAPVVAGYSFGAWVAAGAAAAGQLGKPPLFLVSPPVAFISFESMAAPPALRAVVTGTRDDFAPLTEVRALLERWQATETLAVIEDSDHFYGSRLSQLAGALKTRIPAVNGTDA